MPPERDSKAGGGVMSPQSQPYGLDERPRQDRRAAVQCNSECRATPGDKGPSNNKSRGTIFATPCVGVVHARHQVRMSIYPFEIAASSSTMHFRVCSAVGVSKKGSAQSSVQRKICCYWVSLTTFVVAECPFSRNRAVLSQESQVTQIK